MIFFSKIDTIDLTHFWPTSETKAKDNTNYWLGQFFEMRWKTHHTSVLAKGMICKISDFGLTRDVYVDDTYWKKSNGRSKWKWFVFKFQHLHSSKLTKKYPRLTPTAHLVKVIFVQKTFIFWMFWPWKHKTKFENKTKIFGNIYAIYFSYTSMSHIFVSHFFQYRWSGYRLKV